jgi:hypothetical protein
MDRHNTRAEQMLVNLGLHWGIESELPGPDQEMTLTLQFDESVTVVLSAEDDDLVVFGRLGEAPTHSKTFLENLLSANLFWRDTHGATLSLEPDTRAVLIAQRLPERDWREVEDLRQAIERFAHVQQSWMAKISDWEHSSDVQNFPTDVGQRV